MHARPKKTPIIWDANSEFFLVTSKTDYHVLLIAC